MAFIFDLAIVFSFFILNILAYHKNFGKNSVESLLFLLSSWLLIFFLLFFYSKNNGNLLHLALFLLPCFASILFLPKFSNTKIINYLHNSKNSYVIFLASGALILTALLAILLLFISFSTQIKQNIAHNKQQYLAQIKENPLLKNSHSTHLAVQKFYLKENLSLKNTSYSSLLNTKQIAVLDPFFLHHELLILIICLLLILRSSY
jgi:hypothetical protein